MAWQPPKRTENTITLAYDEQRELSIIKQAIIKSAIEGGIIVKEKGETDTQFVERWIKYVRRNSQVDYKLFKEQESPF